MFYIRFFFFFLCLPLLGFSQLNSSNASLSWDYGRGYLKTFDLREKGSVSEFFLQDAWLPATYTNAEGIVGKQEYYTKFDILNNEVNININGKIMVAPLGVVKGFTTHEAEGDRIFIALKPDNWDKAATYFEVIVDGPIQLLVHYFVKDVGNSYNPAVDAGTKNSKFVKKESYYILVDGKIFKVPTKRKSGERLFSDFSGSKKYFAKNKVKFKHKDDLIELVNFLNKK